MAPKTKKKPDKGQAKRDRAKRAKSASRGTKPVKAQAAAPLEGRKLPSKQYLKNLMKTVNSREGDAADCAAEARNAVSQAVKDEHINAPAFRQVKKEMRMGEKNPNKLRTFLDDLTYYREVFGIEDLAGEQLFAPREGAEDESDSEDGEGNTGDKVVEFPSAA